MQIGLALNHYMMAHEVLPPGTQNDTGPIQSKEGAGYHMGWLTQILPHLEQQNVYEHIDFTKSVYDPVNVPVRQHKINFLVCPSDPGGGVTATTALTNYCGIHNDFETPIDVNQNGVLFLNSSIRYEQIRDGSSNTIFVMENRLASGGDLGWMSGTRSTLRNTVIAIPNSASPTNGAPSENGETDEPTTTQPEPMFQLHASINTPNSNALRQEIANMEAGIEFVGGGGSFHTGGAHFNLGDGSVRFISLNTDPKVLRNLANRADGEMMKDF